MSAVHPSQDDLTAEDWRMYALTADQYVCTNSQRLANSVLRRVAELRELAVMFADEQKRAEETGVASSWEPMTAQEVAQHVHCTEQSVTRRCRTELAEAGLAWKVGRSWVLHPKSIEVLT
ncbi:hypothetical protein [Actinospongicola halichondriae]|uniref:hypothetical protein n=1 Tax=Actinospongicola halichondriae TaxID=3236844 RepID=UPI003D592260